MNVKTIRNQFIGDLYPLVLRTSDDREYSVPPPEFIAIGKSVVAVVDKNGGISVLDASHLGAIKSLKAKNGAVSNN